MPQPAGGGGLPSTPPSEDGTPEFFEQLLASIEIKPSAAVEKYAATLVAAGAIGRDIEELFTAEELQADYGFKPLHVRRVEMYREARKAVASPEDGVDAESVATLRAELKQWRERCRVLTAEVATQSQARELGSLKLPALIERARAAGVSQDSLNEAGDAAAPKAAIVELIQAVTTKTARSVLPEGMPPLGLDLAPEPEPQLEPEPETEPELETEPGLEPQRVPAKHAAAGGPIILDGHDYADILDEEMDEEDLLICAREEHCAVPPRSAAADDGSSAEDYTSVLRSALKAHFHGLRELFTAVDADGSGGLDSEELVDLCGRLGIEMSTDEVVAALKEMDTDGDGTVDFREFSAWYKQVRTPRAAA